jgi:hypothetical protein
MVLVSPQLVDVTVGSIMSPAMFDDDCGGGTGLPGVCTSPAYAGRLRIKARIAVGQIAFKVFMVLSYSIFGLVKAVDHEDGSPTAGSVTRMIAVHQTSCKNSCIIVKG